MLVVLSTALADGLIFQKCKIKKTGANKTENICQPKMQSTSAPYSIVLYFSGLPLSFFCLFNIYIQIVLLLISVNVKHGLGCIISPALVVAGASLMPG